MDKNKMKTEDIKIHGQNHGNGNRRLETAASKRSTAEDVCSSLINPKKEAEDRDSTDLSGSFQGYVFK
jgi:hypothetical protein